MSLCSQLQDNAACLDEIKATLAILNVDQLNQCLDQIKDLVCDPDWVAPDCLAAPASETEMVVEGDQTANYQAGSEFTVYDDQGNAIGTADVVSSTYNAATNQTTVAYTNLQSTTAAPVVATSIKAVKKRVALKEPARGEK